MKTLNLISINVTNMNFAHSQLILDGIDIIKTMNYLTHSDETSGRYYVENRVGDNTVNLASKVGGMIKPTLLASFVKATKIIISLVVMTVVLLGLFVGWKLFRSRGICRMNKINKQREVIYLGENNKEVNNNESDEINYNKDEDNGDNRESCKFSEGDEKIMSGSQRLSENITVNETEKNKTLSTLSLDQLTKRAIQLFKK
jgi:hypothetical protein